MFFHALYQLSNLLTLFPTAVCAIIRSSPTLVNMYRIPIHCFCTCGHATDTYLQAVPIVVAPATPSSKSQPAVAETFEWPIPSSSYAGALNASARLHVPPRVAPSQRFHAFEKLCIEVSLL